MALLRWARAETRWLLRFGSEPFLWVLVLLMALVSVAAYARPFRYTLDIGGDGEWEKFDVPYLRAGFNQDRERQSDDAPAFRWAFDDARVIFPGVGASARALHVRVISGQPNAVVQSVWSVSNRPLLTVALAPQGRSYHVLVPDGLSDLDLGFQTPAFSAPNDPRALGFAIDEIAVGGFAGSLPPRMVALWLALIAVASYLLPRRWSLTPPLAFGIGVAVVALLGAALAFERLGATTFLPRLTALLLAAYFVTLILLPLLEGTARLFGLTVAPTEVRAITALVMLAWIIRLGGLLHPQAYTNDLGLHANNLRGVIRGQVIFTENLPGEAGGGPAPYPPAQYVMMLPFGAFADAGILLQIGTTLVDSLVIAWGWLLLRAGGANAGAAMWAGALYLFALPTLWSSLVGEVANVWGQALVAPMVLLLWRWEHERPPPTVRGWVALAIVPAVFVMWALLGHFGVFLSLLVFFAAYAGTLLVLRGPWLRFVLLAGVCVVASVVLYYSAHMQILLESPQRATVPFGLGRVSGQLGKALGGSGMLGPLVPVLGVIGLGIVAYRLPRLRSILLAWWAGTLLSLAPLLWTEQALRWTLFVFPAIALTGGVALDALASRGRGGRIAAFVLVAALALWGAVLWYSQIVSYNH